MKQVKSRINEKVHTLLKQESTKQGLTMSAKIRYYIYQGLRSDLQRRKEIEKNAINQKTK